MTKETSQYKVLTGWDSGQHVRLVLKKDTETVVKELVNVEWYFVVKKLAFDKLSADFFEKFNKWIGRRVVTRLVEAEEYVKIYCDETARDPKTTKLIEILTKQKNIIAYESDLSRTKRYMVDKLIPIADKLDILYFDIETDDTKGGIEIGRDRILSWAAYNNLGKHWFKVDDDEKKVIESLLKVIAKHDVFVGWNSLKFDWPYIQKRMEVYDLKFNWRKKIHLDLMKRCIKMYSYEMDKIGLTGFSLDEVARVFLGEHKVVHEQGFKEMFDKNRVLLKEYNLKDAELLMKLDTKLDIIQLMINECVWTGTTLDRFYVGELLDNYMLRKSKTLNKYLLSRPTKEVAEKNADIFIIGGYVMPPITGLYDDVRIFDFKSLYPSIMVSWNIGDDSIDIEKTKLGDVEFKKFVNYPRKIEDVIFTEWFNFLRKQKKLIDPNDECVQTANNNFFRKNVKSFISGLIEELLALRKEMQKKLVGLHVGSPEYGSVRSSQAIVKELANSMYGVCGERSSRYFNKNIAESITITGQFLAKAAAHLITRLSGQTVIYEDTDSAFCPITGTEEEIHALTEKINAKLKEYLNKYFHLDVNTVHLEYEKAYRKMIMVDKKRYTGTMQMMNDVPSDILFSKGLEDVKKNTIRITRLKMRELIIMITKDDKQLEDIKVWLADLKKYVFNSTDIKVEDIRISTRISKPTYKYAIKTAHVQLAEKMIEKGLIAQPSEDADSWGTRITYIISTATPKQVAVHVDDFDGTWDKKYYWDTQIYSPLMRVLQVVWPEEDWELHLMSVEDKRMKEAVKLEVKQRQIEIADARKKERLERDEARKLRNAEYEKKKIANKIDLAKKKKDLEVVRLEKKKEREDARIARQKEREKVETEKLLKKSKQQKLPLQM